MSWARFELAGYLFNPWYCSDCIGQRLELDLSWLATCFNPCYCSYSRTMSWAGLITFCVCVLSTKCIGIHPTGQWPDFQSLVIYLNESGFGGRLGSTWIEPKLEFFFPAYRKIQAIKIRTQASRPSGPSMATVPPPPPLPPNLSSTPPPPPPYSTEKTQNLTYCSQSKAFKTASPSQRFFFTNLLSQGASFAVLSFFFNSISIFHVFPYPLHDFY